MKKQWLLVLGAAIAAAVLLGGCSENGVGGAFYEQKVGKIERDNIANYNTVTIGNQTWTAENLKIKTGMSWCYNDDPANCEKYGRLYDWNTAMKICPTGWHLPTRQDWDVLVTTAGGSSVAGKKLKSSTGWNYYSDSYVGTNDYEFSALPGGHRSSGGYVDNAGDYGNWWTATEYGSGYAYYRRMYCYYDSVYEDYYGVLSYGFSVRCVKE